jgi:carbon monoxide dehydrogenase subunit G
MNVRGRQTLAASRADVFAAICDPTVLMSVIPGCRDLEQVGDEYRGRIALRLPGIAGTFRTLVRLVDAEPPGFGRLEGEVEGGPGSIRGEASFRLTEADGGTTVDYEGTAQLGGPLARLDGRFVEGLAGTLIGQGLRNLDARLQKDRPGRAGSPTTPTTTGTRA